ncbi:hypothetical protein D3C80_1370710 [compost metagenome]
MGAVAGLLCTGRDKRPRCTWFRTQREGQRQVDKGVIVRRPVVADILGVGGPEVVAHLTPIVAVAGRQALRSAASPVALVTGIEVNAAELLVAPQALVDGQVCAGFRVSRAILAFVAQCVHVFTEGAVALGRIAVGR